MLASKSIARFLSASGTNDNIVIASKRVPGRRGNGPGNPASLPAFLTVEFPAHVGSGTDGRPTRVSLESNTGSAKTAIVFGGDFCPAPSFLKAASVDAEGK